MKTNDDTQSRESRLLANTTTEAMATLRYLHEQTQRTHDQEKGETSLRFNPSQPDAKHSLNGLLRSINIALGTNFIVTNDKSPLLVPDVIYEDGKLSLAALIENAPFLPETSVSNIMPISRMFTSSQNTPAL